MNIPSGTTAITIYGQKDEDTKIFIKQNHFRNGDCHWISSWDKIKFGANTACLCNWRSDRSSLYIQHNESLNISLTHFKSKNDTHMFVSLAKCGQVKSLIDLCLETVHMHKFPLKHIKKVSYIKNHELLPEKNLKCNVTNAWGDEFNSCKNNFKFF